MHRYQNIGLFLKNTSDKKFIIEQIVKNELLKEYLNLAGLKGELHSAITINKLIEEELRHDHFVVKSDKNQGLFSMSSGERKKALLKYLVSQKPDFMILDDIYGNIDKETQKAVKKELIELAEHILFIQIFFRKGDALPFLDKVFSINEQNRIIDEQNLNDFLTKDSSGSFNIKNLEVPLAYNKTEKAETQKLVELNSISAYYGKCQVLNDINWTIKQNEFWQLAGPNGSGKSTLVSMITGDNSFGYGQNLFLFGKKKGTGESIWDIKHKIGYFTPAMIHRFNHNDSVENMIISGFKDSVGLYSKASKMQQQIASRWLNLLEMDNGKQKFRNLSVGQQRMIMVARAMVKHPPLLILDEPTIELDDENSIRFVKMINAIKSENNTAIIYVSHRDEEGLNPDNIFELVPTHSGYTGQVKK